MSDGFKYSGYKCDREAQQNTQAGVKKVIDENQRLDVLFASRQMQKCPKCGGRTSQRTLDVCRCERCGYEKKSDLRKIRDALEEYGSMPAYQLAKIAGVPRDVVSAYLSDGALSVGAIGGASPTCGVCGSKLLNGTVCPKCSRANKDAFENHNIREGQLMFKQEQKKTKDNGRMHYLDRHGR